MTKEDWSPAEFLPYAPFWRRAASYLVDGLILVPVISMEVVVVATAPSVRVAVSAMISLWVAWLAYIMYFHSQWGQTAGKMSLGIKVVQTSGAPITLSHAIRRSSVDIALTL